MLEAIADRFSTSPRSPVLHSPAEHALDFDNVTLPSEDGTPLEGWFVPVVGDGALDGLFRVGRHALRLVLSRQFVGPGFPLEGSRG